MMETHNLTCRLSRIAALAEATLAQMDATVSHQFIARGSPLEHGIALGGLLREEIAGLRQQVAAEQTAALVRRISA
jgi:hypothetical protein